jgi:hypothetical protein
MLWSTAAFLVRAGFLVMWLPPDVRGFRSVRAREGHAVRPSMQLPARTTTGRPRQLASVVYGRACQRLCLPVAVRSAVRS